MEQAEYGTLLKQAATTIRTLTQDRDDARSELADRERRERSDKVASLMVSRGLLAEEDHAEKSAALVSGQEDLDVMEKAIELSASPESIGKLAEVGAAPAGTGAKTQLEQYLMNFVGQTDAPGETTLVQ